MSKYCIGIGGQKCASSWVHAVLAAHPDVATASQKELDFFSYHHDRGYTWYRRQFSSEGIRFENSPSYLHDARAPERVARFAPGARIIITLRDPVARAFSHHLHEIRKGHIPNTPFRKALQDNPDYLEQGYFGRYLRRWKEYFSPHAILCLLQEDIAAQPKTAYDQIVRHLDLNPSVLPMAVGEERNVSERPKSRLLRGTLRTAGAAARSAGYTEFVGRAKKWAVFKRVLDWNSQNLREEVTPLSQLDRLEFAGYFSEDMRDLAVQLGRTSLPWTSWDLVRKNEVRLMKSSYV